jgi:hypothetical protein
MAKHAQGLIVALALVCWGCASPSPREEPKVTWPASWASSLGRTVTVEGVALDAKLGAVVRGGEGQGEIAIDQLAAWPPGYYLGLQNGRRVRVTGRVIERADLPVFEEPAPGAPQSTGIPVPKGADLARASRHFLLADAKWTLLDAPTGAPGP